MCHWNCYTLMGIFIFEGVGNRMTILPIKHSFHEEMATYRIVAAHLPV